MAVVAWIRRRFWGLAIGAGVTLLTALAYVLGWLAPLERALLDYNLRHFNRISADPRIVVIDINDLALERIHRWPWPRRMQADLVDVLAECGAEAILLDLVYAEYTPARIEHPSLDPEANELDHRGVLGEVSWRDAIRDDQELADAIARAGNVYVAMFFPTYPPDRDVHAVRSMARKLLDENPAIDLETFAAELGAQGAGESEVIFTHARLDYHLRRDFILREGDLAKALQMSPDEVAEHLAYVKELAARYLVGRLLEADPATSFAEVCARLLPEQPADVDSPDARDLLRAYQYVLSGRDAFRHALGGGGLLAGVIPNGGDPTLPIGPLARAARRVGFVNFEKDVDGVLRHVPLMANVEGRMIPQIAFALAADVLELDVASSVVERGRVLRIPDRTGRNTWRVPLNSRGQMLLNWHVPPAEPVWYRSFYHVPVAQVMEVALNRRMVAENESRARLRLAEAVQLMFAGAESAYLDYERAVRRLTEIGRERVGKDASGEIGALQSDIADIERRAVAHVVQMADEIRDLVPEDDEERDLFVRVRALHEDLAEGSGGYAAQIAACNAGLRQRNDKLLGELRRRVGGKLCLVGHTASAQADMVNTPVFENMPGVMAHANLVNTLLTRRIPTVASVALNVAIIVVTGLLITVLTSWRGPAVTLCSVLLLMAFTLAASAVAMYYYAHYLAAIVPTVGVFVTWALVTLYRQLTEQRQRRSFARELSRNTSPAIAARISEQLARLDLAPRPAEVTCYFSDLQGFTSISERAGVEATQTILNRYLGTMGEVLIGYRAFNKFMGDGIFAFFNAPIWPVDDHVAVGCEAALDTQDKLTWLKSTAAEAHAAEFGDLRMRIGLHTGPVFAGYFGSENQTDYTCIGDTVNLAARLESANKIFGTGVMVSGAVRDAVAGGYEFRHLGALQVKGKAQAVAVYELLGRVGEVDDAVLSYARQFSSAVGQFQVRQWDAARRSFGLCGQQRPADAGVRLYLAEIESVEACPPPEGWNQAIELTAK